eukprot:CAMPEP_0202963938 /NCGR_PEP_ID=MMETSP1396-20130829/8002_1 /ASSEMBLY_ACC=CAM_ASM_000872 /TAXON_ID= /ORGANISM="Pseudokeronopsis sp., Strain Brazil" /LENGTH=34 /DNA_ID= /DNA_START= /DNA_END= /DNA_ORIENTATION=
MKLEEASYRVKAVERMRLEDLEMIERLKEGIRAN